MSPKRTTTWMKSFKYFQKINAAVPVFLMVQYSWIHLYSNDMQKWIFQQQQKKMSLTWKLNDRCVICLGSDTEVCRGQYYSLFLCMCVKLIDTFSPAIPWLLHGSVTLLTIVPKCSRFSVFRFRMNRIIWINFHIKNQPETVIHVIHT